MIGSLAGDVIGSRFEFHNSLPFDALFANKSVYTDDTVLTVATADTLLNNESFAKNYLEYAQAFPNRGFGGMFLKAVKSGVLLPYNSYGNGSMMRVGPVGWAFDNISDVISWAKKSAEVSHNHPSGILGAQAVAAAIFFARHKATKEQIKDELQSGIFNYDLGAKVGDFQKGKFNVSCQDTVPKCMAIFFECTSFVNAMEISHAVGGDVDTNNAIIGSICDAYYGLPEQNIIDEVYARIPKHFANITTQFVKKYIDHDFVEPKQISTKTATFVDSLSSLF